MIRSIIIFVVIAIGAGLLLRVEALPPVAKTVITVVLVIYAIVWLLELFGVHTGVPIPH